MTKILEKSRAKHWTSDSLEILTDAERWGEALAEAILEHVEEAIQAGNNPAGGRQRPLASGSSAAKAAAAGRRPSARGVTDRAIFANSIVAQKLRGNAKRAAYLVTTDKAEVFAEWLQRELGRGVDYFPTDGDVERLVERALEKLLDQAIK